MKLLQKQDVDEASCTGTILGSLLWGVLWTERADKVDAVPAPADSF